ncbi:hypothetical protein PV10_05307 [Exophiala mesophila]|uniref:BRCT domain-containing protein n=1 Tax=Exophiala mesophila TaxID=212818 RepID=A0A0D1ZV29_EXOME|nr:uncharacterized protein PV10_05307 [Exophiala mesophila]KIV90678.1 hypothetical protein PV10_05307 [Exophiala mesophila]
MPSHNPQLPPPPQPTRVFFDPFNSSSTGHQRAENRLSGSTSWRESRNYKLSHQFRDSSGAGGSMHLSDLVGAGSENYGKDGRKDNGDWEKGAPGLREEGWQDIRTLMTGCRKRRVNDDCDSMKRAKKLEKGDQHNSPHNLHQAHSKDSITSLNNKHDLKVATTTMTLDDDDKFQLITTTPPIPPPPPPQIFRNLTFYLNGSTAPLVSDHKIKQLFVQHGGNASFALGRRTVTHVILGNTCGGGLASGKLNKEITTIGGKGIKYVTAQWVLDSVAKGIRQPEARYAPKALDGRIGGSRQGSVRNMFARSAK